MIDTPFVKTGDCSDPEVRENHAKALVTALELGNKSTSMLVRLEDNMKAHQDTVCQKLEGIQADLKEMTGRLVQGDRSMALLARDLKENRKDINGIGHKFRAHQENHTDRAVVDRISVEVDRHIEWHDHQRELADSRRLQLFRDIRTPAVRWLIVGVISLAVVGGVVSSALMLMRTLPAIHTVLDATQRRDPTPYEQPNSKLSNGVARPSERNATSGGDR